MIQEILRPLTVREALRAKSRPRAAWLGGGTWLNGVESDEHEILISLEKLGLGKIESVEGMCTVGATASLQQIVDAPGVPSALRQAASLTASRTLRNMETIGGELGLCSADSALIAVLVAMNADVALAGKKKKSPVEQLCRERTKDLILSVTVPLVPCAVKAVSRTSHSSRSLVVAVSCREITPRLKDVRICVSDCVGQRVRLHEVERALEGAILPAKEVIEETVSRAFTPKADLHASSAYKRYIAGVLVADALQSLI
jgi:putative selenate reductase FAD-binding subunit